MFSIRYAFKMEGRYSDGLQVIVGAGSEDHCMARLIDLIDDHGDLVWYSGYCDEDYENGEYIGRDNFIYD